MKFIFLVPLLLGFAFNSASAFTASISTRLGERRGRLVCIILRDVLGIPLWAAGYALAVLAGTPAIFLPRPVLSALVWVLILAGSTIIVVGLVSLRWKAAAPSLKDSLVTTGI